MFYVPIRWYHVRHPGSRRFALCKVPLNLPHLAGERSRFASRSMQKPISCSVTAVSDDPESGVQTKRVNTGSDWGRGNWGRHCSSKPRMLSVRDCGDAGTTSISHEVTRATVRLFVTFIIF